VTGKWRIVQPELKMREEVFNVKFLHYCYEIFIRGPGYRVERITVSPSDYQDILKGGRETLDLMDNPFDLKRGKMATFLDVDLYVNKIAPIGIVEVKHGKYKIRTSHVLITTWESHSGAILDCRYTSCRKYLIAHVMET